MAEGKKPIIVEDLDVAEELDAEGSALVDDIAAALKTAEEEWEAFFPQGEEKPADQKTEEVKESLEEEISLAMIETENVPSGSGDAPVRQPQKQVPKQPQKQRPPRPEASGASKVPDLPNTEFPQKPKRRRLMVVIILGILVVLGSAGFMVYRHVENQKMEEYYSAHFLPATYINEVDCSNMTVEEVESYFSREIENYSLSIKGLSGAQDQITADDIRLESHFDVSFQGILDQQNGSGWRSAEKNPSHYNAASAWTYDETLLKTKFDQSPLFQNMTESKDAEILFDEGINQYIIQYEVVGTKVDTNAVYQMVQEAVATLQHELDLDAQGCYTPARQADAAMETAVQTMNVYMKSQVELDFGSAGKESLPVEVLCSAIVLDASWQVSLTMAPVEEWIQSIAKKYDTYNTSRSFASTLSGTVTVSGGSYGWQINQTATLEKIQEAVQAGGTYQDKPVYSKEAASHKADADFGDTYIEIDLTNQRVFLYKNGSKIWSSDCVSGNTSKNNRTITGVYSIYSKERNRMLKGADYESFVSYWMPFSGGYGLHDASWRSSFGGSIYKTNGSHGCVNLPSSKASALYSEIYVGIPVIAFGGASNSGTNTPATTTTAPTTTAPTTAAPTTAAPTTTTEPPTTTTAPPPTTTVPPDTEPTNTDPPDTDPPDTTDNTSDGNA